MDSGQYDGDEVIEMRMMIAVLALLLSAGNVARGQTAKVIQLSAADAAKAKTLYAQKQDIDNKIVVF